MPKHREAMERMTKRLTEGGMPHDKARQIAQNEAVKADRRERDKR